MTKIDDATKRAVIDVTNEVLDHSADPYSGSEYTDTTAIKAALKKRGVTLSSNRIRQVIEGEPTLDVFMSAADEKRAGARVFHDAVFFVVRKPALTNTGGRSIS